MKLTETDKELFKALSLSQHGKDLVDYLERLESWACDSRTWAGDEDKTSANHAARIIKDLIRRKIVPGKEQVKVINEHE